MKTKTAALKKWCLLLGTLIAVCMLSASAFAAAPAKVGGVKTSVGEISVRIDWNKVSGCDGYYVYLYDVSAKKMSEYKVKSGNTGFYKITGLKRLSEYKTQVAAYKGKDIGPRSSSVTFKTKIIPPFAINISLRSELQSKVQFVWSKSELAQYYELWRKTWNVDDKAKLVNKHDTLQSCTMGHLKAGYTYTFYVRGVREYKGKKYYGPFSSVTVSPYTVETDKKLASQINTSYAYGGGSNAKRNYTRAQVEAYVNSTNGGRRYYSANNYLVWCNTNNYHVYIFTNKNRPGGRWSLLYSTPCIIGRSSHNTPRGIFTFYARKPRTEYTGCHAEYISYFCSANAIHSLLYPAQPDSLGQGYMASGGCIRLMRKYCKFIYDNCQHSTLIVR